MKNYIAKIHVYMPVVVIVAIVAFGFVIYDIQSRLIKTENMIAHLDDEVDEANAGVKRLLKRNSGSATSDNLSGLLPIVEVGEGEFDFGVIEKKNGIVNTDFMIKNEGEGVLKIKAGDITTSCGCTTAKVDKEEIPTGESVTLTVFFDPNFHEEPQGRFFRSIFVPTNDPDNSEMEFKIFVEIKN
ncbi:MAG: DUF1573 domain-containing protein [Parcubacteria group bacterium]|nr:DUF1573 domain-containing protein [Parcubacteria group bacterium]MCR4342712.1 DUF1573 domain-containing protein [Patescibacteria group bacterium]